MAAELGYYGSLSGSRRQIVAVVLVLVCVGALLRYLHRPMVVVVVQPPPPQ